MFLTFYVNKNTQLLKVSTGNMLTNQAKGARRKAKKPASKLGALSP